MSSYPTAHRCSVLFIVESSPSSYGVHDLRHVRKRHVSHRASVIRGDASHGDGELAVERKRSRVCRPVSTRVGLGGEGSFEGGERAIDIDHGRRGVVSDAGRDSIENRRHVVETTPRRDRKSTRLNSSHSQISYAVFCLKKKKKTTRTDQQQPRRLRALPVRSLRTRSFHDDPLCTPHRNLDMHRDIRGTDSGARVSNTSQ